MPALKKLVEFSALDLLDLVDLVDLVFSVEFPPVDWFKSEHPQKENPIDFIEENKDGVFGFDFALRKPIH